MTYWPISSPSIFAASKSTYAEPTRVSHDGLEEVQSETGGETPEHREGEAKEKNDAPIVQEHISSQLVEEDINGDIVAARITRSGHVFATLTRTTLTVWQTKACLSPYSMTYLLMMYAAYSGTSFRSALRTIPKNIWSQYRRSTSSRLSDLCCADCARLSHHLLSRNRSYLPRIPNTLHKHTWGPLEEEQHHLRLQAAASAWGQHRAWRRQRPERAEP